MVKRNLLLGVLFVLFSFSCHRDMKHIASNDIEILNKSILDISDTIIMELPEFDTGCFSQYMQDFNSRRCNILVKISLSNSDTLVDFFTYDTTHIKAVENVVVNGLLKKDTNISILISDEGEYAKGILYETQQNRRIIQLDLNSALHKPMVLRNGKLKINSPPLIKEED